MKIGDNQVILDKAIIALNGIKEFKTSPMAGRIAELVSDIEMADEIDWKQEAVKKAAFLLSLNPAVVAQTLQQIKESKLITIREAKLGNTKTIIELILAELSKSTKLLTDPKNQKLITDYIYGIEYNSKDDVPKDQNCIESIAYLLGIAKDKVHAVISSVMSTSNPVQENVNESETLSIRDLETHYYDNEEEIKSNMSTYGFKKSDIKKINNYMDFANVLGVDSRSVKDVDLREYTQALVSLMEAVHKIKRRWTDLHPAVHINPDARLRNKIISYVGSKPLSRVTTEEYREFCNSMKEDEEIGKSPSQSWLSKNKRLIETVKVGNTDYLKLTKIGKRVYQHLEEKKQQVTEGYEYELVDANGKNISTLGYIPKNLFLNGKKYTGEAAFVNGYNGYTSTDDDATLCAVINKSCWDKNKKPNYLTDENGYRIESVGRRGQTVTIDEAKEDFAIGDKVSVAGAIFDKDANVWKDATGEVIDNKDVRDRLRVRLEDGTEADFFSSKVTKINEASTQTNESTGIDTALTDDMKDDIKVEFEQFGINDHSYITYDQFIGTVSPCLTVGDLIEKLDDLLNTDTKDIILKILGINESLNESTTQTGDAWMSLKKGDVITIAEGPHDPITAKFRLDADPIPAGGETELVVTCLDYKGPDDQDCLKKGESGTIYPMLDAEFIKESLSSKMDWKETSVDNFTSRIPNGRTVEVKTDDGKMSYVVDESSRPLTGQAWMNLKPGDTILLADGPTHGPENEIKCKFRIEAAPIEVGNGEIELKATCVEYEGPDAKDVLKKGETGNIYPHLNDVFIMEDATQSTGAVHKSGFHISNLAADDRIAGPDGELLVTAVGSDSFTAKNKNGRSNEYTSLEGFTPVKVKSMNESLEMFDDAELTKAGFDVKNLSAEQKNLIVQPIEAPENYHQDGEITAQEAKVLWLQKMKKSGMSTTDVANALKYVFGGKSNEEELIGPAKKEKDRVGGIAFHPPIHNDSSAPPDVQPVSMPAGTSESATTWSTAKWPDDNGKFADSECWMAKIQTVDGEKTVHLLVRGGKNKFIYHFDGVTPSINPNIGVDTVDQAKTHVEKDVKDFYSNSGEYKGYVDESKMMSGEEIYRVLGQSGPIISSITTKGVMINGKFQIISVEGQPGIVDIYLLENGKVKYTSVVGASVADDIMDYVTNNEKRLTSIDIISQELDSKLDVPFDINEEEMIPGGLSSGKTLQDVADHHGLDLDTMTLALEQGTTIEMEHTSDENVAREIATDHLWEDPNYYDKLSTIE